MKKYKTHHTKLALSIDLFNNFFLTVLFILTVLNPSRVPNWESHALQDVAALIIYNLLAYFIRRIPGESLHVSLHIFLVVGLYSYLFQAIAPLQLILFDDWLDTFLISLEYQIYGTELSLYLQQYTSPILTEWMMFTYVIYVPLIPGVALICYFSAGRIAGESYLLTLVVAYALCYIGFILFPLATQLHFMPKAYNVPLEGWLFTWFGEWIRANQHYPGGALPSPHTAASTVMLLCLYKYHRISFYILLPIVLSLYVSTVYGRYHYVSDAVLGIVIAFLVYGICSRFIRYITSIDHQKKNMSMS